jgi:hypothetical protein
MFVGDQYVIEIDRLAHEGTGFGIGLGGFEEIGAHAGPKILGLADIDDVPLSVFVEIYARLRRKRADFLKEVHARIKCSSC